MLFADVAELADALDLGSSVTDVGVQVPSSAPIKAITLVIAFFVYFIQKAPTIHQVLNFALLPYSL
jgi:hypothetical protein